MARLTLEGMADELKKCCGENLVSVVLYGSAAAGDHAGKRSDYNLLVVCRSLAVEDLDALSKVSARWAGQGNPPPLLFTLARLKSSADVFPIEFSDIQESRRVLFGPDPMADLKFSMENLRLELEHELKGKLIRLRERYLLTEGRPKAVLDLMVGSLSTFLVLFRNALRLYGEKPPARKLDALARLAGRVPCDVEVFKTISSLKEGAKIKDMEPADLFRRYLKTVEEVVDRIDQHLRGA